jgi:hypothetical protein
MAIITILLLVITFIHIYLQSKYIKKQREECQKYPFYKLRDEIVWKIITAREYKKYLGIYDQVNGAIGKLKSFNFSFYSNVIETTFSVILELAYKNNFKPTKEVIRRIKEFKLTPFQQNFANLIFKTAKENSLSLRLAMTKFGYRILFTPNFIKAVIKFLKRHPEFLKKNRDKVNTIRNYSYLNHVYSH